MSEVKIISIGELKRRVESDFKRAVKACRIEPTIIHQVQPIADRLRVIEALESIGVGDVVFEMPDHAVYLDPPFPIEVELFYKSMRRLNIRVGGAYIHNSTAYIYIMGFGRDLYAVVPCSPPPDPLGEPDMTYNGVRMYSVGRFKQYIEWWKKYVYVLADIYIMDVNQYVECLERCMPRGDEVGYIWLPDYVKREYYDVFEIILDEELRSAGEG